MELPLGCTDGRKEALLLSPCFRVYAAERLTETLLTYPYGEVLPSHLPCGHLVPLLSPDNTAFLKLLRFDYPAQFAA